ncbi:hypothetical protein CC1G_13849 [Coprinopsis cinerea okayama7|uniref:Uncharacterized protein n=1 Tax=Coprinopsis cinerea (strain Okayama-7 / 130 / ATCC MYA-4618 / FGSC 9003) TaxID=240176 RepID=D6RKL1_COPC7|nr:hypothetical protein CC1G_13849 [Coprinopsis cinerea okayama7\|eukprot:XP_002911814.1 hypothetical protein CC1G_13849 [Coprinopsis cinerea okayama7\
MTFQQQYYNTYPVTNGPKFSSDSSLLGALGFVTPNTQHNIRLPQDIFCLQCPPRQALSRPDDRIPHVTTLFGDGVPFRFLDGRHDYVVHQIIKDPNGPAFDEAENVPDILQFHIRWPGYEPQTYELFARDSPNGPSVTRLEFMKRVVKLFKKFFSTAQEEDKICTEPEWRIGDDGIKFEDLKLGKIMNVFAREHWQADIIVDKSQR